MDEMKTLLDFAVSNGFAMVVCLYCLLVNNKTVKDNTEAVNKMIVVLDTMAKGRSDE